MLSWRRDRGRPNAWFAGYCLLDLLKDGLTQAMIPPQSRNLPDNATFRHSSGYLLEAAYYIFRQEARVSVLSGSCRGRYMVQMILARRVRAL
jgi:hypothetical protein